jgi:hypothetical protein
MTCIIRTITHYPCPTCGVTRAMLSLLNGNIEKYLYYNAMALPLFISVSIFFVSHFLKKDKYKLLSYIILLINIPYYIFRLINNTIP